MLYCSGFCSSLADRNFSNEDFLTGRGASSGVSSLFEVSVGAVDLSARKAYAAVLQHGPPKGVQPAYLICSRL